MLPECRGAHGRARAAPERLIRLLRSLTPAGRLRCAPASCVAANAAPGRTGEFSEPLTRHATNTKGPRWDPLRSWRATGMMPECRGAHGRARAAPERLIRLLRSLTPAGRLRCAPASGVAADAAPGRTGEFSEPLTRHTTNTKGPRWDPFVFVARPERFELPTP